MIVPGLTVPGLPAVIVNATQARASARVMGRRAKIDQIDAIMIARSAAAIDPPVRSRHWPGNRVFKSCADGLVHCCHVWNTLTARL